MFPWTGQGRAVETGPAAAFLGREIPGGWNVVLEHGRDGGSHEQSWTRTVRTLGGLQMLRVQYCDLLMQITLINCKPLSDDCWRRK